MISFSREDSRSLNVLTFLTRSMRIMFTSRVRLRIPRSKSVLCVERMICREMFV